MPPPPPELENPTPILSLGPVPSLPTVATGGDVATVWDRGPWGGIVRSNLHAWKPAIDHRDLREQFGLLVKDEAQLLRNGQVLRFRAKVRHWWCPGGSDTKLIQLGCLWERIVEVSKALDWGRDRGIGENSYCHPWPRKPRSSLR